MFPRIVWLPCLICLALGSVAPAPLAQGEATPTGSAIPPASVELLSPEPGQAVQGTLSILGHTAVEGFASAELAFAYTENPTDTWFLINITSTPISHGVLAEWDTTTISDGRYSLRLVVNLVDGAQVVQSISGLRVRNYTPIETDTPMPTDTPAPGEPPTATATPEPTATPLPPTPTPPPPNPAAIAPVEILSSLTTGVLIVFGLFGFGILIGWLRSFRRRS